jgi:hypothetical protein
LKDSSDYHDASTEKDGLLAAKDVSYHDGKDSTDKAADVAECSNRSNHRIVAIKSESMEEILDHNDTACKHRLARCQQDGKDRCAENILIIAKKGHVSSTGNNDPES